MTDAAACPPAPMILRCLEGLRLGLSDCTLATQPATGVLLMWISSSYSEQVGRTALAFSGDSPLQSAMAALKTAKKELRQHIKVALSALGAEQITQQSTQSPPVKSLCRPALMVCSQRIMPWQHCSPCLSTRQPSGSACTSPCLVVR